MKKKEKPKPVKVKKFKPSDHWVGMPEFVQEDVKPVKSIIVHFHSKEEMLRLSKLVGQEICAKTKYIHLPFRKAISETDHRWSDKKK